MGQWHLRLSAKILALLRLSANFFQLRLRFSVLSVPRESRRKWKWVLVFTLKALYLTCVRSHTSREIKKATISEFSTFLKQIQGTISFTVNSFSPYLPLTVKIFQFLRLSTKFWAVLRLSVNPIETLIYEFPVKKRAQSSPLGQIMGSGFQRKFKMVDEDSHSTE